MELYSKEGFIKVMEAMGYSFKKHDHSSFRLLFLDESNPDVSRFYLQDIQFVYDDFGEKDFRRLLDIVATRNRNSAAVRLRQQIGSEFLRMFELTEVPKLR